MWGVGGYIVLLFTKVTVYSIWGWFGGWRGILWWYLFFRVGWFFRASVILVLICCGFIYLGWVGCPVIFPQISSLPDRSCPGRQTHTPSLPRIPLVFPLDRAELCVLSKGDPLYSPWLGWGLKIFLFPPGAMWKTFL